MTTRPTGPVYLALDPGVAWRRDGSCVFVESAGSELVVSGPGVEQLVPLFDLLTHGAVVSHDTYRRLGPLVAAQIASRTVLDPTDADSFLDEYFSNCDRWAEMIFRSPFWEVFLAGNASPPQVLGLLAQLYHRTVGADLHNRLAFERCTDPAIRPLLEQHYQEEYGHAQILGRGLARCGLQHHAIEARGPSRPMRALLAFMNETSWDSIAYLGCYGVFHAPATVQTERALVAQFSSFAELYPYAAPGFEAVLQHSRIDYQLDHDQIALERHVRMHGVPSAAAIRAVAAAAREVAARFRAVFDGLAELRPDSPFPDGTNPARGNRPLV